MADAKRSKAAGAAHRADRGDARGGWRKRVTEALHVPTIGIGAGPDCSGQVLVLHDMLDIYPGPQGALREELHGRPDQHRLRREAYVAAVKDGSFPALEHCF